MKVVGLIIVSFILFSCASSEKQKDQINTQDELSFKVIDSKYLNSEAMWKPFEKELQSFSDERYHTLRSYILEKDIPTIQKYIANGVFSYEELTLFFLKRIQLYDRNNDKSLNSIISFNPNVIDEARSLDTSLKDGSEMHPIFGMPVLLKDNINTLEMPTTAGAVALAENFSEDAHIVKQLKAHGALILGKTNLSEWAYFFCGDCPSGYSAIGGQTLNPYGRKNIDTGGSSSGSGVATAVNFAVASVGTETSGSILSPSSQNSVVGMKPTVGLLSRSGIIPISSTLDTPGPITKFVVDNAILLSAMAGYDVQDEASYTVENTSNYYLNLNKASISGKRLGVFNHLLGDSLYANAVKHIEGLGGVIIKIEQENSSLPNFLRLLNLDMQKDLPLYFSYYGNQNLGYKTVNDIINFNQKDSLNRAPYGQKLFLGVVSDTASEKEFIAIKDTLFRNGRKFFDIPMKKYRLDGILSINNYHAGYAAVAKYPALTVPMGYDNSNTPKGLTFITKTGGEMELLQWGYAFEKATSLRKIPQEYKN
ncbi:amidase family protein [Planktosalinus lacus]|uniref:Amidase n=1 Tax=Planktosalinus lacus TaxID=1526573 RepID=A0A8J2VCF2_9FLAO|nr:amidase family protein [Planktosalinus lacus]GGE01062.1 amidase [Planktosalinus lacus]